MEVDLDLIRLDG